MKIAMLASGGVDSSVALRLLKEQGHDVTAFYLKIWLEDELAFLGECPWEEDLGYVREICAQCDVPLEIISLQKEYWDRVVQYTIDTVQAGRTPNPDIHCNDRIKFGAFFDRIDDSFEKVATGHYAQVEHTPTRSILKMSKDSWKDQTYFLAHLSQQQLSRALFPIGGYTKAEVRALAESFDLPNKKRKDSQGICFLGTIKYSDFIKHHLGEKKGALIELESGEKKGDHKGFWFYTIGQRQGLGLSGGPWYVVKKDPGNNIVYISRNYHANDKKRDTFYVEDFSWVSGFTFEVGETRHLRVKVRHGELIYDALVTFETEDRAKIKLNETDQGLAPGQFAVFYHNDECLGCATISENDPT